MYWPTLVHDPQVRHFRVTLRCYYNIILLITHSLRYVCSSNANYFCAFQYPSVRNCNQEYIADNFDIIIYFNLYNPYLLALLFTAIKHLFEQPGKQIVTTC